MVSKTVLELGKLPMRIGFFGGSFDPLHYGHLILAEQCREQAQLDQVLFVPAARSPFKDRGPIASDKQRLEMLSLGLAGHADLQISTLEIDRGGTSYTIDTLKAMFQQDDKDEIFLLMGQDSLQRFNEWREAQAICQVATPLVVRRPNNVTGQTQEVNVEPLVPFLDPERLATVGRMAMRSRLIDISSSEIRSRSQAQQSIRYLLPRAIEKFIETQKLYLAE